MGKHTPGPWAWRDEPMRSDLMSLKGEVLRYDSYEGIWFSRYNKDEDEANARLVAAAPELLELVKRYRAETPLGHQPHMIASLADALIAKAEGNALEEIRQKSAKS